MGTWIRLLLCLAVVSDATEVSTLGTIGKVVRLLQNMMDKSKTDGDNDRTVYTRFRCYCDQNEKGTRDTLAGAIKTIDEETTFLADRRERNSVLSQEVAALDKAMDDNVQSEAEARSQRQKARRDFVSYESDLETGIDQLERAINLLNAVGADQTANTAEDHTRFMAASATAAAGGPSGLSGLIATKAKVNSLDNETTVALAAVSVFLPDSEQAKLTSFLQAPFNGVYSSQSGEIIGILKNMNDTYWQNLHEAREEDAQATTAHRAFLDKSDKEYRKMRSSRNSKVGQIGTNAGAIATSSTDLSTAEGTKTSQENFLSDLLSRCDTKTKEYEERKMLRANEEAAIAKAMGILNNDAAFETFGSVNATSTGATQAFFLQRFVQKVDSVAHQAATNLRSVHTQRCDKVAELLEEDQMPAARGGSNATYMKFDEQNPFLQVLDLIEGTISLIDEEEVDDQNKMNWCSWEQANGTSDRQDKIDEIGGLKSDIDGWKISVGTATTGTKGNIAREKSRIASYKSSIQTETETRQATNNQFQEELRNMQEAETILTAAIKTLETFYDWLHTHNAAHSYTETPGKDSGGSNIKQITGATVDELKKACSDMAECKGFNTQGWLKSDIADETKWYDLTGNSLYVKTYTQTRSAAAQGFLQLEEPRGVRGTEMKGQRKEGDKVIGMLEYVKSETQKEMSTIITQEQRSQASFEILMRSLESNLETSEENLDNYEENLATLETNLEEGYEDKATATRERRAIDQYLDQIEPECTWIQGKHAIRKRERKAEKAALKGAITLLKGTPLFQDAIAEEEEKKLGECKEPCNTNGESHATCQACIEGVSVYGYCVQNTDAAGCDAALPTGSAASIPPPVV